MDKILKTIESIICDILDDDYDISFETTASDVSGWDSLANISILAAIQDEFNIVFTIDEVKSIKNVGNLVELIKTKI